MKTVRIVMLTLQLICNASPIITPGATIGTAAKSAKDNNLTLDVLTVYNPTTSQCDSSPLVTASNQRINKSKLRSGSIRWMALSRDLLRRWGGKLHYGDTVELAAGDPGIDGLWVIQDTMNKRFKNRGDLLFDEGIRRTGKWSQVTIRPRKKSFFSAEADELFTGRP